jgi:hypothetical protein
MATHLYCQGTITFNDAKGKVFCSTGWEQAPALEQFDISALDPQLIALMMGSGFFIMVPLWVAIVGGRAILQSIH